MKKDQQNQSDSVKKNSDRAEPAAPPPPPVQSPGKPMIRVKFKIPTVQEPMSSPVAEAAEAAAAAVVPEEEKEDVKDHCCVECHKTFSSGKALGGHMSSAHVQANRDFPVKKLKSKTKKRMIQFSGGTSSSGKFTCSVCFKDFPTNKSLFGHMRCHPDRDWRGMDPPADPAKTSTEQQFPTTDGGSGSSNVVVDDDNQIYDSPLKWVVRGKRGRPATKPVVVHSSSPASSEEIVAEEEILAVEQLVRLVNGQPKVIKEGEASSSNSWIPQSETEYGVNRGFQLNKQKENIVFKDEVDERVFVKKMKIWDPIDENPLDEQSKKIPSSSDDLTDDLLESGTNGSLEKTPETPPDLGLEGPAASPDKYICSTCGKSFLTPQALGGHRSSHKKFKMRVYNTIDDQSFHGGSTSSASIVDPNANVSKQLEASNVLGDQIHCNCINAGECNHHAGPVTATDEATKASKVLFDLNELPNCDGEDGTMDPDNNNNNNK